MSWMHTGSGRGHAEPRDPGRPHGERAVVVARVALRHVELHGTAPVLLGHLQERKLREVRVLDGLQGPLVDEG
eukprot:3149006-Lingulodinium_polyedra.AAC.1